MRSRIRLVALFTSSRSQGFENLQSRIARLSELNPLAVSITWSAGGNSMERSLELAGMTQSEHGIDTIMHLTCTNMEKGTVDAALRVRTCAISSTSCLNYVGAGSEGAWY